MFRVGLLSVRIVPVPCLSPWRCFMSESIWPTQHRGFCTITPKICFWVGIQELYLTTGRYASFSFVNIFMRNLFLWSLNLEFHLIQLLVLLLSVNFSVSWHGFSFFGAWSLDIVFFSSFFLGSIRTTNFIGILCKLIYIMVEVWPIEFLTTSETADCIWI